MPRLQSKARDGVHLLLDDGALSGGLMIAFSDRRGGVSDAPFDSLNLAARVGDQPEPVEENRRRVARAAGYDPAALVLARQVHGSKIIEAFAGQSGVVGEADALMTRAPGVVLGILTADCAAVVLASNKGVAVVHAGWRGLVAGAIERAAGALGEIRNAWVGPCAHACCYEVGPEVIAAFETRSLPVAGKSRVDLARACASVLDGLGIQAVAVADRCTHCDSSYFSYRRDGRTGRQGAFVAMLD